MSRLSEHEPACFGGVGTALELVIESRPRDLGGFMVRRTLPSAARRRVGPFVFCDHMGPAEFAAGQGIDVRPHPHIGLATMTYLLEGEILHRDSLGTELVIRPGEVNWMVAGRGIVHSERSTPVTRTSGYRLDGVQTWLALPLEHEEIAPRFEHYDADQLPTVELPGAKLVVVAGSSYGVKAPTGVLSPTLFVHAKLEAVATLRVDDSHRERAAYIMRGSVECDGRSFDEGTMLVFRADTPALLHARVAAEVMLLGGAPLEGTRHLYWNFVSSSRERIEQAKADWRERRFPTVPGDDEEFIPLPE